MHTVPDKTNSTLKRLLGVLGIVSIASLIVVACGGGESRQTSKAVPPAPTQSEQSQRLTSSKTGSADKTETINGMTVPSEPDVKLNATTLAGVDSDKNGIRDDIDRILATEFGNSHPKIEALLAFAKAEQAMLVTGTPESIAATDQIFICSELKASDTNKLTAALLDAPARSTTYRQMMSKSPSINLDSMLDACPKP